MLDSMYESKVEGYESNRQQKSPLLKKAIPNPRYPSLQFQQSNLMSQKGDFRPGDKPQVKYSINDLQHNIDSEHKGSTLSESNLNPEKPHQYEQYLQESYNPRVYLSITVKSPLGKNSSCFRTIVLDQMLQFENIRQLEQMIDAQLTQFEDELISNFKQQRNKR